MRVIVLTKEDRDYSRLVDTFVTDFYRQTGHELEVLDPDTGEGESLCRTYDVVSYPTILAIGQDGQMQNMWEGETLPTINEVSYYASQD